LLPMSVPSHCALMKPAAAKLAEYLKNVPVVSPSKPVIQNADVTAFADPAAIKNALVEQLYRPVRWIETIQSIAKQGATVVIECVPGKILTGLNRRIEPTVSCLAVSDVASLKIALEALSAA
jgi:[acyl-carrier-protein] S-malonyltransferase